jgi:hypothetical protein
MRPNESAPLPRLSSFSKRSRSAPMQRAMSLAVLRSTTALSGKADNTRSPVSRFSRTSSHPSGRNLAQGSRVSTLTLTWPSGRAYSARSSGLLRSKTSSESKAAIRKASFSSRVRGWALPVSTLADQRPSRSPAIGTVASCISFGRNVPPKGANHICKEARVFWSPESASGVKLRQLRQDMEPER